MRVVTLAAGLAAWLVCATHVWAEDGPASQEHIETSPSSGEASESDIEALRSRIRRAGTSDTHDGADAVVVLDHSTARVASTGQSHTVRRRVIKILTERGAAALSRLRFDYDPATMDIELRSVRVIPRESTANPRVVDRGQALDIPQPASVIYWGFRSITIPVPRPRVGDAVEVVIYQTGFQIAYLDEEQNRERFVPPMRGHFYDIVLFGQDSYPTLSQRYEVTTPRDKPLQFEIYNGPIHVSSTFDDDGNHYAFWLERMPGFRSEPRAPNPWDMLPKVVLASVPDWPSKSRWFFHVNERQFEPNDEIRATVRQITAGARSDEERVTRLTRWVARFVRYRGLNMGEGEGYTLHTGTLTYVHRAGVCKDIASMLITMMRIAGLTAYPVMTMAGARVERIPADQFNHAVVAWQLDDGNYRLLDPTWAPFSRQLWSNAEREQHYLVGTAEGEELAMIPPQGPEHNEYVVTGQGRISADGTVTSTVTIGAVGFPEDRLRRLIGSRSALETRPVIGRMARSISPFAQLEAYGFDDVLDLDHPFHVRYRYRATGYAQRDASLLHLVLPLGHDVLVGTGLSGYMHATESSTRSQPLMMPCAMTVRIEEHLELPRGYQLVAPVRRHLRNGAGSFESSIRQVRGHLVLTMRLQLDRRRYSASDYNEVRALVAGQRALANQSIILRHGEGGRP